jgi:uncharacterized protein (DUF1800 family)
MPHEKAIEWNRKTARHLLSRTISCTNNGAVDFALSHSLEDFVNQFLLKEGEMPPPPADWADTIPLVLNGPHNDQYLIELAEWYSKLLYSHNFSFREKMVLFLHNHFTTAAAKTFQIQRVYKQSKILRNHAFGNLRELTKEITIDPAMLIYLDGGLNTKNLVNENYSRELLELFTLGLGNYTEEDIKSGALALTGWTVPNNSLDSLFDPKRHFAGTVTYLGQPGVSNYIQVVDTIFDKPETALFFSKKIYCEFVSQVPNDEAIQDLAQVLIDNNYELKPFLYYFFTSPFFYEDRIRSTKIKTPVEFVMSSVHLFDLSIDGFTNINNFLIRLDQKLFNPPDVKGWRGQRRWINSTTYAVRNAFTDMLLFGKNMDGDDFSPTVEVINWAKQFPSHNHALDFIDELNDYLFVYPLSQARKDQLLSYLTDGNDPIYWNINLDDAADRLRMLLKRALSYPEFQLH